VSPIHGGLPDFGRASPLACLVPPIGPPAPGPRLSMQDFPSGPDARSGYYYLVGVPRGAEVEP